MNEDMQLSLVPDGGLFQSPLWQEFQKTLGKETFDTPLFRGVLDTAPVLGKYAEVSRGPVQQTLDAQELKKLFVDLAKKNNLSLIRIEPQHESLLKDILATGLRVRKAPLDAQPKEFLMLPLEKNEDEIFAAMKSKTRYNIRLAQKKGVIVRPVANEQEESQFLDLLAATAKRKNISFRTRSYYKKFIQFFVGEKGTTFVAVSDGKVLAGSTLVFFGHTAYYAHGGSSDEGRNSMAPHLLQWEQIRLSKAKNCVQYDFGGVALQHMEAGKDWVGITRFKAGFAPQESSILLPGTYDIIFSPCRYFLYQALTTIKNFFL